jgi:hypothetical protein
MTRCIKHSVSCIIMLAATIFFIMLNVVMLSFISINVVILTVVMLNVLVPRKVELHLHILATFCTLTLVIALAGEF